MPTSDTNSESNVPVDPATQTEVPEEDVPPTGASGVVSNLCMAIVKKDIAEVTRYVFDIIAVSIYITEHRFMGF